MRVLTEITNKALIDSAAKELKKKETTIVEIHGTPEEADNIEKGLSNTGYVFRKEYPIQGDKTEKYYLFELIRKKR